MELSGFEHMYFLNSFSLFCFFIILIVGFHGWIIAIMSHTTERCSCLFSSVIIPRYLFFFFSFLLSFLVLLLYPAVVVGSLKKISRIV